MLTKSQDVDESLKYYYDKLFIRANNSILNAISIFSKLQKKGMIETFLN